VCVFESEWCLEETASRSHGGSYGWWCGYVSTFGAVTVLVSDVGDRVEDTVWAGVGVRALHHLEKEGIFGQFLCGNFRAS
jgi:hypothetical protein